MHQMVGEKGSSSLLSEPEPELHCAARAASLLPPALIATTGFERAAARVDMNLRA
jgi:hypothetical protein